MGITAINNDPERATDPRKFNPDRYEGDKTTIGESAALADPSERDNFTFGAGRRICPGLHIAERSLFITMSSLLWAFNFEHATDEHGDQIPIEPEALTPGFVAAPQPYK
jgi:cytochrome P450